LVKKKEQKKKTIPNFIKFLFYYFFQFNFAEAVNFALPDWIPFGQKCIERYREFHKPPVFSHDEMLLATANNCNDIEMGLK